jgi:hypothetical protein
LVSAAQASAKRREEPTARDAAAVPQQEAVVGVSDVAAAPQQAGVAV